MHYVPSNPRSSNTNKKYEKFKESQESKLISGTVQTMALFFLSPQKQQRLEAFQGMSGLLSVGLSSLNK